MTFDLRLPIGLLFTLFGVILMGYGLLGPTGIYTRCFGINMNLLWGAVQLVFGLAMLAWVHLSRSRQR